jgi:hypothetical protein
MKKKKFGQRIHAKLRAEQRFGIKLNRDDIKNIVHMIQNSQSIFVRRASRVKSGHAVYYKGNKFYTVYDKNTQTIATIMPLSYAVSDVLKDVQDLLTPWNNQPAELVQSNPSQVIRSAAEQVETAYTLFKEALK